MTDYEHLLSPGKQYLSYDDIMFKFGLPQNNKDFCAYIELTLRKICKDFFFWFPQVEIA